MLAVTAPTRYRFTVEEYHRMGEAGIFTEDDRVELWEGEIIAMAPIGNRHMVCVSALYHMLDQGVGDRAAVVSQQPILLSDSEPQPDIAVVRAPLSRYLSGHPRPEDILLIIEVADTPLVYDRDRKMPRYGMEGIPDAWLWDLGTDQISVHRDPGPDGYRSVTTYGSGDSLTPLAFGDVRIAVDEVMR